MITVRREKNGKTHHAEKVSPGGCVVEWNLNPAKAASLTADQAAAVKAFYAGKRNAGTLHFSDGSCVETPTAPPPGPDPFTRARTLLGLPVGATADHVIAAAVEELEAYRGTKDGPSPHVEVEFDESAFKEYQKRAAEALRGANDELSRTAKELAERTANEAALQAKLAEKTAPATFPVTDDQIDALMSGQSVPLADGAVTLFRPADQTTTV